jgi:hypothetical protein
MISKGRPTYYVVVPMRPKGSEDWSEELAAAILIRDTLIGVTLPEMNPSETAKLQTRVTVHSFMTALQN